LGPKCPYTDQTATTSGNSLCKFADDNDILIDRLYHSFGIRDEVLSWIRSFVTGRTQRVLVGDQYSSSSADYGVRPQGSVLGPILFLLPVYTADVLAIAARHGVGVHSYADDTQLYLHTTTDNCMRPTVKRRSHA